VNRNCYHIKPKNEEENKLTRIYKKLKLRIWWCRKCTVEITMVKNREWGVVPHFENKEHFKPETRKLEKTWVAVMCLPFFFLFFSLRLPGCHEVVQKCLMAQSKAISHI